MNSKLTRFAAAATAGAVLALGGTGSAQATTGTPVAAAEQAQARQLHRLVVSLRNAATAQDLAGIRSATGEVRTVLPTLKARGAEVLRADAQAAELLQVLPSLPVPLPSPVIAGPVPSLLASLIVILSGLLGGFPVPIPVPDLPAPDLPAPDMAGSLPTP
jgi:hypothetical protein